MTQVNMLGEEEERELRETYGYTDIEIEMVSEAHRYAKMADSLRADAAQDAYKRRHPNGPPEDHDA